MAHFHVISVYSKHCSRTRILWGMGKIKKQWIFCVKRERFSIWANVRRKANRKMSWEKLWKFWWMVDGGWLSPSLCKFFRWLAYLKPPWNIVIVEITTELKDGELNENSSLYIFSWTVCLQAFDIFPWGIQARRLQSYLRTFLAVTFVNCVPAVCLFP